METGRERTFVVEALERRCLLAGVTLVTHGFGGSASGWVTEMGNLFARRAGELANQPRYLMTVTDPGHDGGPLTVASSRLGAAPANWSSTEIIVLLDWSDVAGSLPFGGYHRPSGHVGAAVATKLLAPLSIPDLAAPLAQLPLHLIGHSRGASVVSEIAANLATRGTWVDQLTYLDPHPVDGVNEPFGFNFGDAPMRVSENVVFADNYWRTDGASSFDFTGESVAGAANLQLTESVMTGNGYSNEHSDVHLWYHGTIGPPYSSNDGGATIGANWYNAPHPARDTVGYRYTRLAASGVRPAAGLKTAGAPRNAVALSVGGASVWDNVEISGLLTDVVTSQGTNVGVNARFEDRSAGGARDATITIGFDRDDNPYNGFFGAGQSFTTSSLPGDTLAAQLPTNDIAGGFRVYAKITNGTTARYYYAPGRAIVTVPGYSKTWIGPASGAWTDGSSWSTAGAPAAGDRVAIYDSDVQLLTATTVDALKLDGANLLVAPGGSNTLRAGALFIEPDATLRLADNGLLIDYTGSSPYATLRDYVTTGRIAPTQTSDTTLALVDNAIWGKTTWANQPIDGTTVIGRYTFYGDADMNGAVTSDDYVAVDVNLGGIDKQWIHGDFNRDGRVTSDEYVAIDVNLGKTVPAPAAPSAATSENVTEVEREVARNTKLPAKKLLRASRLRSQ